MYLINFLNKLFFFEMPMSSLKMQLALVFVLLIMFLLVNVAINWLINLDSLNFLSYLLTSLLGFLLLFFFFYFTNVQDEVIFRLLKELLQALVFLGLVLVIGVSLRAVIKKRNLSWLVISLLVLVSILIPIFWFFWPIHFT